MEKYKLKKLENTPFSVEISLASSKSESNRALIINALANGKDNLSNISSARDSQTMIRLLNSFEETADVLDAGTTMRFLTAYFCATNQSKIMTGTPRMCERPIGILVDSLRTLGASIQYLGKEGFPPIKIEHFKEQVSETVSLRGDVSSQYISAMLMIAPTLAKGLTIELVGEIGSKPYIEMTIAQMKAFGVEVETNWVNKTLKISPQKYRPVNYSIESDWSGASYWFSVVALSQQPIEVDLLGLKKQSLQGDSAIVEIMKAFGVKSKFHKNGVLLTKIKAKKFLEYDYTSCPDLVQTVVACAAGIGIELELTGIESLKIKETDRVLALQEQVTKMGSELIEIEERTKYILKNNKSKNVTNQIISFETYDDHRMAMAFAPLALIQDIIIEEPHVVAKSYPSYWKDLSKIIEIESL